MHFSLLAQLKNQIVLLQLRLLSLKCVVFFPSPLPSHQRRLANYKALAEHQEEQLRKLKEELRRAQQEQDVTGKFKT